MSKLIERIQRAELVQKTKSDLVELYISTLARLNAANLKLAMARVTISDQQESIDHKRKALTRSTKVVRSLRQTVKRRRKF